MSLEEKIVYHVLLYKILYFQMFLQMNQWKASVFNKHYAFWINLKELHINLKRRLYISIIVLYLAA